ncbi:hypothetical protein PG999_014543 [Apiospora kogelbergensis]|uniref:Heterokaryon incompatibility domain-containing protein n=1 Tax=Apiospora kogelbergensis TaxID=1337665 RepID=A0AAW0QBN6_9PEZI
MSTVSPQAWLDAVLHSQTESPLPPCATCENLFWLIYSGIWDRKPFAKEVKASGDEFCKRCQLVWCGVSAALPNIRTWDDVLLHALRVTGNAQTGQEDFLRVGVQTNGYSHGLARSQVLLQSPAPPDSDEWYGLLRRWISDCDKRHPACESVGDSTLPKRVLDLDFDQGRSRDIVLLEPGQHCNGRYIALSYSWGGRQDLVTTRENLDSRLTRISWDQLPILFQDVIKIARALCVRFLWIDALCIVQGDERDWMHESQKMAAYYGNACLTIAADHSPNVRHTCFPTMMGPAIRLDKMSAGTELPVLVRRAPIHFNLKEHRQERNSSKGFCPDEYYIWASKKPCGKCCSAVLCECGRPADIWNGKPELEIVPFRKIHQQTLQSIETALSLEEYWEVLLAKYIVRKLSFYGDRLKAIASLAKEFKASDETNAGQSRTLQLGDYTYGLWTKTLPAALLWANLSDEAVVRNSKFPTWSWNSIAGSWYYEQVPSTAEHFVPKSIVLEVPAESWDIDTQHESADSTPPYIVLEGSALEVSCCCVSAARKTTAKRVWTLSGVGDDRRLIVNLDIPPGHGITEINATCLEIGTSGCDDSKRCWGLLLEPSASFPGQYVRLGNMTASADWFRDNQGTVGKYSII